MWKKFEDGSTVGESGSEKGIIILDEEHPAGARITLEKDGHQPFAITCGIYGSMVHTVFSSSLDEAKIKYDTMKARLEEILNEADEDKFLKAITTFSAEFI